jgi:putative tryptophan/tyrosine transport system substrate-binding protein
MKRRQFIAGLGGAAAWSPRLASAQQQAMPVVGFLHIGMADEAQAASFRKGLSETGYVEGRNVAIDYRWAQNDAARLAQMAADLVRRRVTVIFAFANVSAAVAKAATSTVPIVFAVGGDPVKMGLVSRLSRPDGNMTGMSFLATEMAAKRIELLHECVPGTTMMAALVNPTNAEATADAVEAAEAARILGLELRILNVGNAPEIDGAFANLVQRGVGGVVIEGDELFLNRISHLVVLTARHRLAAIFPSREFPDAGGLMSYGSDRFDSIRAAGAYVGRILKGEKVVDLPVQRSTKLQLVVNLATAKALDLTVPNSILERADEVIE